MLTLTDTQRQSIRESLLADRARLLVSVSSLSRDEATLVESQGSGENRPRSEGDGDAVAVERALVAKLSEQASNALSEIDAALGRLEDGSYGQCDRCGLDIPAERMEVRPRTTVCVPCATRR